MEAAGEEQALNRERCPGWKRQDESSGTSAAERASCGVAPVVSVYEMPVGKLAWDIGCSVARRAPLSDQCHWQQLQTALPPVHAHR